MTSPLRLLQLPRITQEDNIFGRVRYGQHVCERYLAGFVNEQNIDSLGKLLGGPYYRHVKARLAVAADQGPEIVTYPEPTAHCMSCRWFGDCDAQRRRD